MRTIKFIIILACLSCLAANQKQTEQNKINKEIDRFSTTLAQIKLFYIKDISYKELISNSLKGMATSLDPHSTYLDETEWQNLNSDMTGEYVGIGVSVIPEDGLLRVITPLDNSPAKTAGIESNDVIFQVNNDLISNLGIDIALKKIQGKPNTSVQLSIYRPETKEVKKIKITRKKIESYPITEKDINNIKYIRIPLFTEKTASELKQTLKKSKNYEGIIIDLRNNPGGILSSAVDVCDLFLDKDKIANNKTRNGNIVSIKGRVPEFNTEFKPHTQALIPNTPLIILVNHGSASASEIVAGTLSSYHRALSLGTTTFGKGSVQTVLPNNGTALKITTALYYLPNSKTIQGTGIKPDIYTKQIQVAKNNKEKSMQEIINEASLKNSIQARTDEIDKKLNSKQVEELAYNDFQLYQAVKVLETMILSKQGETL